MLDICLLGCGGMMPMPNRWLTSLLIRYNGKMILIDCGEGTQIPMKVLGWGFKSIEAALFTHYHADHISGLPGFLLTLGNCDKVKPLKLYGPNNLSNVVNGLSVICPELPYKIEINELSNDKENVFTIDELIIKSFPVIHTMPCLAYCIEIKRAGKFDENKAKDKNIPLKYWSRLQKGETIYENGEKCYTPDLVLGKERKGLKVSYCTDTRYFEEISNFVYESDLLICEGIYGENSKKQKAMDKKHMIFSDAANIAKKGNVKELILTHFSPALDYPENYIDNARNIFENTKVGKNLYIKSLKFSD